MKVTFWLLDINSETANDSTELWLWGIDEKGNRVLVIDGSFVDYFYAVMAEGFDPSKVAEEIRKTHGTATVKLEVTERKLFGKTVQTVKVYCRNPAEKAKLARTLRNLEGIKDCLEDDIRLSMRYLIDNNVVPCAWHEVDADEEESTQRVRADKVYAAKSPPKLLEKSDVPSLRTLSFHMTCYSREGTPKPDRNPVIIISTAASTGEEKQFLPNTGNNDKALIQEFAAYVKKLDPDIIAGYGTNTLDWNYLRERCRTLGIKLDIDRACTEPHTSVYGHVSLTGMANIDIADFADRFPEVKVKTLWNLAEHLGVAKTSESTVIEDVDFADYWDDKQKRIALKQFSMDSARSVKGMVELLLDFAMQLSSLVSLPLDHVMTAAVGFRVEWFLIKHAQKIGELIPRRVEQPYRPYAGGLVLKPQAGLHENIAVLDFKSMYPNIMIAYNLSPDTYVSPKEPEPASGVFTAPEVKHRFRKSPPGFYKEILTYLIGVRGEIRDKMKKLNPEAVEYRVLDARQKAVKVITNAAYGYAGWIGARWYIKPVAEAASAWGRHTIQTAISMAERAGLKVVYGDTDSLFVTYDEKKTRELEKEIEKELGLDVERGEVYVRIFFTEAKKRYAGLRQDGSLDIVGLEVIRGDWAEVAKNVQEHVLEIILKEKSAEKAVSYVQSVVDELKQRKVPFRDLIIWKTLTKPVDEYAVKASHVEAAKALKNKGWRLAVGDKVGYIISTGEGKLYDRAKPHVFATIDDADVDYYISKQVVPAAARVLEFFGVSEEDLLKTATQKKQAAKSLMEFMK
ncbi:MAG: DNA polymerase II [Candidatus Bathyarchaeota archaeon]|nr:DNA polymerase II [Candidatus Bathyarchaeota archaeon]